MFALSIDRPDDATILQTAGMSRPKYSAPRVLTVVICLSALLLLAGCAGVSQQSPAPAGRATPPPPAGQTTGTYPAPPVTTPWPTRISPASQQIPSFASLAPAVDRSIARAAKKPPQSIAIDRPGAQMTWGQLHHVWAQKIQSAHSKRPGGRRGDHGDLLVHRF